MKRRAPVVLTDEINFSVEMKDNSIKREQPMNDGSVNFDICRTLGHASEKENLQLQLSFRDIAPSRVEIFLFS